MMISLDYHEYEEAGEVWSAKSIVCPHCKRLQEDIFEITGAYTEDGGECTCQRCGREFRFSAYISYTWTSYKDSNEIEDQKPESEKP